MVERTRKLFAAAAEGTPVEHSSWEPLNLRRRRQEGEMQNGRIKAGKTGLNQTERIL